MVRRHAPQATPTSKITCFTLSWFRFNQICFLETLCQEECVMQVCLNQLIGGTSSHIKNNLLYSIVVLVQSNLFFRNSLPRRMCNAGLFEQIDWWDFVPHQK
jgi:hypothetical protein